MNYLTKLVLSKVSASELYDFIMEDARVFSSIIYDIIYRISGSFVFLYKKELGVRNPPSSAIHITLNIVSKFLHSIFFYDR